MSQGMIAIHIRGAMTTAGVRARIDGRKVSLRLPSTVVAVGVGRHEVGVEGMQGLTPFGETQLQVNVPAGRQVDVHYALPRTIISAGRIGTTPQTRSSKPNWHNIVITFGGALLVLVLSVAIFAGWDTIWGR